ncbi:MAG: transglutaminase domain-containing protein [Candidatus Hodarchaeota archaeon]
MSDIREELIDTGINKKRVIGVILVVLLLISVFAFSTFIISFLFGTQRPNPNRQKADTDYEDAELIKPPYPFDEDFFNDLFNDLSPDELADVMEMLEDMMDSSIDDLDLSDFSEALLALLGSQAAQQEVFRVYDYDSFPNMTNKFWRYECFDEFTGDQWQSTAATNPYPFLTYAEYFGQYSSLDIIQLKMPLSPNLGLNSMVIPSFFPIPFIMEGSVYADNLDLGTIALHKTDFNCTTIDLDFNSEDPVNMSYELFGLNLPSNNDINNSAIEAQYTPIFIQNKYLQLPPSIDTYINTHPYFKSHYDVLDIIIKDTDTSFVVANKIRNYLQSNFTVGIDALTNDPPADGEDIVEWFCAHEEGLWSEFASAFCAFTRAFNVSSRFVDGFNSWGIEEGYDIDEGKDFFAIKYLNLYNWAEIYVPTDISGDGMWVLMDIIGDSFGQGGNPMANYNIEVFTNFTAGYRGQWANLTAILSSPTGSIDNKEITFTDLGSGLPLGTSYTNQNGSASILVNINNSFVVGPHVIMATYQLANNFTSFIVFGDIEVNFTSVNPTVVNRSISNTTNIQGYVYDPIASQRVRNATVQFVLFEKGTSNIVPNPFDITYTDTDSNGDFDVFTNVNPHVSRGNYEIRVDFNGSWGGWPLAWGIMNDSSNRIEFNVTEKLTSILLFSINGQPTDYPSFPSSVVNVKRGQQVDLSVILIDESTMFPTPGEIVEFYDYTNGDVIIGADITDAFGRASILYNIGNTNKSGPTLVYARYGGDFNYSYYIVNESIGVNLISYTSPLEYDLANPIPFNIQCELIDLFANPIYYSQLDLRMNSTIDYTGFLTPSNPEYPSPTGSNFFNFNRGVNPGIPLDNYTLTLEFNGFFNFYAYPYPASFSLGYLYNSVEIPKELYIYDTNLVTIFLDVEGNPTRTFYDDFNPPERYNNATTAHFQVQVNHVQALDGRTVYIYDDFTNIELQNYVFPGGTGLTGFVQFNISTASLHAGLHRIRVQYHTYSTINTTYIIINETVNIDANSNKNEVIRGVESFAVSGTVEDFNTFERLRGLRVSIILLNSSLNDVSGYLNLVGSQSIVINNDGTYSFTVSSVDQAILQGNYYIRIDFNGSIEYPAGFPSVDLNDYMIHTSSSLISLDINADTQLIGLSYSLEYDIFPNLWIDGDTLYVWGELRWDNNTAIAGVLINVTIIDERGGIIVAYNDIVSTDLSGGFNVSIFIDENDPWPSLKSDVEIRVSFNPIINGMVYVEPDEESIFPP